MCNDGDVKPHKRRLMISLPCFNNTTSFSESFKVKTRQFKVFSKFLVWFNVLIIISFWLEKKHSWEIIITRRLFTSLHTQLIFLFRVTLMALKRFLKKKFSFGKNYFKTNWKEFSSAKLQINFLSTLIIVINLANSLFSYKSTKLLTLIDFT